MELMSGMETMCTAPRTMTASLARFVLRVVSLLLERS